MNALGPFHHGLLHPVVPLLSEDVPDLHRHIDLGRGMAEAQAPLRDLGPDRGDVLVRIWSTTNRRIREVSRRRRPRGGRSWPSSTPRPYASAISDAPSLSVSFRSHGTKYCTNTALVSRRCAPMERLRSLPWDTARTSRRVRQIPRGGSGVRHLRAGRGPSSHRGLV